MTQFTLKKMKRRKIQIEKEEEVEERICVLFRPTQTIAFGWWWWWLWWAEPIADQIYYWKHWSWCFFFHLPKYFHFSLQTITLNRCLYMSFPYFDSTRVFCWWLFYVFAHFRSDFVSFSLYFDRKKAVEPRSIFEQNLCRIIIIDWINLCVMNPNVLCKQ